MKKLIFAIIIMVVVIALEAVAQENPKKIILRQNHQNKLWGYLDTTMSQIIPAKYKAGLPFKNGLAGVKTKKGWGYIDENDDVIIPFMYDDARPFGPPDESGIQIAGVKIKKDWIFINQNNEKIPSITKGKMIEDVGYFSLDSVSLCPIKMEGLWGYVNPAGKWIIKPQYKSAENFLEGRATVITISGQENTINLRGKMVKSPK